MWCTRDFTMAEAARLAGIHPVTLRTWVMNHGAAFSERRGGRRWFSPRDIAVIAAARELADAGMPVPDAIDAACRLLADPPAADALALASGRSVRAAGIADLVKARGAAIRSVPIGRIAAGISANCAELFQRAAA